MKYQEREDLLQTLLARVEKNMHRHKGVAWASVLARLKNSPEALKSLLAMESTGGEPDVIAHDKKTGHFTFCNCSPPEIRALGGALFCDRRYETVFVYHNRAESYYAARGFRGSLRI